MAVEEEEVVAVRCATMLPPVPWTSWDPETPGPRTVFTRERRTTRTAHCI